jgi:hypothetical protein
VESKSRFESAGADTMRPVWTPMFEMGDVMVKKFAKMEICGKNMDDLGAEPLAAIVQEHRQCKVGWGFTPVRDGKC